jgi:hypothetical protein
MNAKVNTNTGTINNNAAGPDRRRGQQRHINNKNGATWMATPIGGVLQNDGTWTGR